MEHFETFGEALTRFMQSRSCSMKELAAQMGIKSANTVARITADKSSIRKINTFCAEFLDKNPLRLVETEKDELREAVAVSAAGADTYAANKQMLDFVRERPQGPGCACRQVYGDDGLFIVTLDDLLLAYREYAQVDIMLQNCALSGVTHALKAFLEKHGDTKINIEHYITASENRVRMVADFTSLLDVMGHPDYHFFFSPLCGGGAENRFSAYGHILVALKCDRDGNKWTDIVHFSAEDGFDLLYNVPGEACYQFNMNQFRALRMQHNPAKATYSNAFSFSGMLEYHNRLLELDLQAPSLIIRPDICLCMIPPDISKAAAEQTCKDRTAELEEILRQYVQVTSRRYQLFSTPGKRRRFLFSRAGILHFLKYGKSCANVFRMRDLTPEERRRVIEGICQVARSVPATTIHLLKNELHYNNISYCLYGDNTLLVDSYQGFSSFDPARSYHSCCIQSPELTKSFAHFAEHDLMEHYVYSNEETIDFLEKLIQ